MMIKYCPTIRIIELIRSILIIFLSLSYLYTMESIEIIAEEVAPPAQAAPSFQGIKIVTIILLLLVGSFYWFWPHQQLSQAACLNDSFHSMTSSANRVFLNSSAFRFGMMVGGQLLIDGCLLGIFVLYIVKFKNFTPIVWVGCFYGFRGFLLNIYKMPYPEGMYWADQGIPTVGVPYEYTRDFFYSGHTGFLVYSLRIWSSYEYRPMQLFSAIGLFQAVLLLIFSRGHYTIDIMAGWLFSEWFSLIMLISMQKIDRSISKVILGFGYLWSELGVKVLKGINMFFQPSQAS